MGFSTAWKREDAADANSRNARNATPFAKVNMHEFSGCGDIAEDKIKTRKMPAAKLINGHITIYGHCNANKRALIGG